MPPIDLFTRAPVHSNNVCNTTACIAASEYILSRVNLTIDPCSDFYQYTCGSWINSPAVKEEYNQGIVSSDVTTFSLQNKRRQAQILESTYEDFKQQIKSNATGFHLEDQAELDKSNFEFYKSYYNVCKDTDLYRVNRFTPIFEDIMMIQKDIMPLNATASQYGRAMAFFIQQSLSVLPFEMDVTLSFLDHDKYEVLIGGSTALKDYTYDREVIVSRLNQVIGQPEAHGFNAQTTIEASQRSGLELWSNNTISTAVDNHERIVSYIRDIYNSSASDFKFEIEDLISSPAISFDAVQQALPNVDISVLLTTLSEGLESSAVASLGFRTAPSFLGDINDMLSTESEKSIQDFFTVQYIVDKYEYLAPSLFPELLNNTLLQQQNSTVSNTTVALMQLQCSEDTNTHFVYGLSRYYGLESFGDENDRQKTLKFIETIRESLLARISSNTWLDDQTKQAAINKMKLTKTDSAYSINNPDWRDPASIKQYYGNQTIDTRSYYHAKNSALLETSKRKWKNISAESTATIWDVLEYPGMINAAYLPNSNSIGVLLGILRKPMYDTGFPEYLNFGNLGSVIGHEFVHGLDNLGSRFNGTGHLENWWTPQAAKEYEERQQCFIEEYSKISIKDEEGNEVFVDGNQTLGENIADAGGLNAAVDAYKLYVRNERQGQPEPSLPGLEHLTPEQMLYISFSLFHCESVPPSQARIYETDVHAPSFARTNPVVQNNADFATTFNCPVDSPMNKKEKCYLW
ncbi:hypothetical protein EDC96DRAFT_562630 [Choanephora cucurbitarum]|nr:hypothetical protein EDC96DRAFT_562630 [Choanephora cucurbitarum]